MLRLILVASLAVAVTAVEERDVEVVKLGSQINVDGSYGYEYELSNGVTAQESGIGGQYANGGFRHYAPDGQLVELAYTADANGFQPIASYLPTPPPIPDYILRAIQYIEQHPTPEEVIDRERRKQYA